VRGNGFVFRVPAGWTVEQSFRALTAHGGGDLVSVTVFRLARPYRPQLWTSVVPQLDRAAARLAAQERAKLASSRTVRISGVRARSYEIDRGAGKERIAFVLSGKREYQLFCRGRADEACSLLESSFALTPSVDESLGAATS
jgi:predicted Zn-dependent protease